MFAKYRINYPATYFVITLSVVMFLITIALDMMTGGRLSTQGILVFLGAENLALVLDGEIWRLILPAFLHADIIHIAMNLYGLWFLGRYVEAYFGSKNLFSIFIYSAILGSVFSLISGLILLFLNLSPSDAVLSTVSVGASGGLFGLMGILYSDRFRKDSFTPNLPIDQGSLTTIIVINLIYGFLMPGINNWAHIGGLLGGFILGFILKPITSFGDKKYQGIIKNTLFYTAATIVTLSFIVHFIVYILL